MELLDVMKNLTIKPTGNESEQKLFKSIAADIDDVPTEIVIADYTDKTLLIVSQYQKIGREEQQVAARYLAEAINITKPLCIFINLKSYDIETVKACKDIILDLKGEENV
ncbi:uncharacterized protein LOC113393437 isoform X3 [Vanessa tameamea]|uniref:Uncharacterized protein LOC113393437 isoform X3 n=1 Tax=Vanessa tameamea TaxID=334116 RepID=A0A8B8HNH0_VANTA|nr:uncharacterized protein LOC113393437 isoform X3 [Vanessa tameamea]